MLCSTAWPTGRKKPRNLHPRYLLVSRLRARNHPACYLQVEQLEINGLLRRQRRAAFNRSRPVGHQPAAPAVGWHSHRPARRRARSAAGHGRLAGKLRSGPLSAWSAARSCHRDGQASLERHGFTLNGMVIEGLLRYGYRTEAAELFSRQMSAVIQNLKRERGFRQFYQAEGERAMGERDHLWGLPVTQPFPAHCRGRNPCPGRVDCARL